MSRVPPLPIIYSLHTFMRASPLPSVGLGAEDTKMNKISLSLYSCNGLTEGLQISSNFVFRVVGEQLVLLLIHAQGTEVLNLPGLQHKWGQTD